VINKQIIPLLLISYVFILPGCKSTSFTPFSCGNSYGNSYEGGIKVGDPYKIKGKTYTPEIDYKYNKVGIASWYGDDFHCKKTANGEMFNKNELSAAHKTLPLPSVVKVTHLGNGKSINVVINDRGPFAHNRIIDLSEKSAIALGMKKQGTAKVRVKFLPKESNKLMAKLSSQKKIYYKGKGKHKPLSSFEIIVEEYRNQKKALITMRRLSRIGKSHLIVRDNNKYIITLAASNKAKANILLKKVRKMGYKNAKIHSS
jgi:rare lipoprotein A (peptidoglycan hydrolase)